MLNLKLSFRNIFKDRVYLFINLLGLSLAFTLSFFILSYIIRETSFNRNYENYDRIARCITVKKQFGWTEPSVSYPLHMKLKNSVPGIEAAAIFRSLRTLRIRIGESDIRVRYAIGTTSDMPEIITPDFIYNNAGEFGNDPASVMISESLANKIFGKVPDPGSVLEAKLRGEERAFTVDAVYRDFPVTASFRPELLASFDLMSFEFPEGSYFANFHDSWHMDLFSEVVLIEESADFESVSRRVSLLSDEQPEDLGYEFTLQPMKRIHLYSTNYVNDGRKGDFMLVMLFSAVGLLVLIIAISNYIILSIGASSRRIPEISTRKIFGARSSAIRTYVIFESVLVCIISLPVAYLLYRLTNEQISRLFNISMDLTQRGKIIMLILVLVVIVLTAVLSGSYLAGNLGRVSPLAALKRTSGKGGGQILYKTLITVQIVIFVTLLSCSFIVLQQLSFSRNQNPGFNNENLIIANFSSGLTTDYNSLRNDLMKNPNIENLTFGGLLPPTGSAMVSIIKPEDGGEDIRVEGLSADFDFVKTAGVEIIAGRDFNPQLATDSSATIINKKLADMLGADRDNLQQVKSFGNVIGIMNDMQIHSVREEIAPMTLQISEARYISSLMARVRPGSESEIKEYLVDKFEKFNPSYLEVATYDEVLKSMYGQETRLGKIVMVFGLIALIIAMMGVFGLSLFLSNELRFNTAVNRVFGAAGATIIRQNTWRYMLYIALGNIISIPLVIVIMNRWLQQFAFRININVWVFIGAFILSATIFISTTLINTIRLANINPADNLRLE